MFRRLGFLRRPALPSPVRNSSCSVFEIDKWAISRFVLDTLVPVVGMQPFPLDELILMAGTVIRFKPHCIFEWGTNVGKSARIFSETARAYGIDLEIHSIDLPDAIDHVEHPRSQRGLYVKNVPGVFLHQGDGLDTSLKLLAARSKPERYLFFVDGDHSFASVKREIEGIMTAMPEAIVLVHDTFYQSSQSGYNVGPHIAIEKVLAEMSFSYLRIDAGLGLPGMSLLYRETALYI